MLTAFTLVAESHADEPVDPSILVPAIPDLVWGSIAFALILGFMLFRFVPKINGALDARSDAIAGGIKRAEEAQAEAKAALAKYNAQLAEARGEAGRIKDEAREDAKTIRAELVEQAQAEAARIVANGQAQIEAERSAALVSLRSEVGSLALDLASGVIGESLTDDKKANGLVDRFLADLAGTSKGKAGK
jgi:F-type H+-transporting ATPase subunit b